MAHSDAGLRRVSIYADAAAVDLALPADVPVASLLPSIAEFVAPQFRRPTLAAPYRLSRPAECALDCSKTLAQNGVYDGAVLVWNRVDAEPPTTRVDDVAAEVSATIGTINRHWPPPATRLCRAVMGSLLATTGAAMLVLMRGVSETADARNLAAGVAAGIGCAALLVGVLAHRVAHDRRGGFVMALWATGFAGVAGFAAVPGGPAAPGALLSAMAASAMAVVALHLIGCGTTVLAAISGAAGIVALAALAATVASVDLQVIGVVTAAGSIGVLQGAARVSITSAGLCPPPGPDSVTSTDAVNGRAGRAHQTLTSLTVVSTAGAALGAVGAALPTDTATRPTHSGGIVFAAAVGAVLLLRARSHADRVQVSALLAGGTVAAAASVLAANMAIPSPSAQAVVAGVVVAAAVLCGIGAPVPAMSPVLHRGLVTFEYLSLAAIAPLTCWSCGLFTAEHFTNLL